MAWYALYKWSRPWRLRPMYSWVRWYKNKLYNDWYQSLSEEDRLEWDKLVREEKERKKREGEQAIGNLLAMHSIMMSRVDSPYLRNPNLFRCLL